MRYISEYYAVNLDDELGCPTDWHGNGYDWTSPYMLESEGSAFGEYGISFRRFEKGGVSGEAYVANHVRACLDMLANGHYGSAGGMREYYIGDEELTPVVFDKVMLLRGSDEWPSVDRFMGKEYGCDWLDYKEGLHGQG